MGCSVDKMGVVDINPYPNRPNPHTYPKQTNGNLSYNNTMNGNSNNLGHRLPPIGQQQQQQQQLQTEKPTYFVKLTDDNPESNATNKKFNGKFEKVELNEKTIERFLQIQAESNFKYNKS
jgi:hypothetical protein